MQQFTVPQFIDVESKIIGPLTTRQFLIILAAAIIAGLSYKFFDFTLFLTIAIVVLSVAVLFSFVKVNGRPFHYFMLNVIQSFRRPGTRVWNNRLTVFEEIDRTPFIKPEIKTAPKEPYQKSRLA